MIRSFIAVEIPFEVRKRIGELIAQWESEGYPVRWVKVDNLHLTLKFLGEIDQAMLALVKTRLSILARRFAPITFSLKDLGCFPSPRSPRVLWIGAERGSDELRVLEKALEDELLPIGLRSELREFSPHLTIARAKMKFDPEKIVATAYTSPSFFIQSLVLFKSTLTPQGPVYEKLNEFPLSGGG